MEFESLNFLDFLKYGALGIALALAILSYRLLSKEQDKETVREPMLKAIRFYLYFAVILSLFFGTVEIFNKSGSSDLTATNAIKNLWEEHLSYYRDSTLDQKIKRIENNWGVANIPVDTSKVCEKLELKLLDYERKLQDCDKGFYANITKLRKAVDQDPDGWINTEFNTAEKADVFRLLEKIFISLDEISQTNTPDEAIIGKWKTIKSRWSVEDQKYIFRSDIPELVRIYLNKYHPHQ